MMALDPRLHAFRPDRADLTLRSLVNADAYVEPVMRQCLRGVLPLLGEPRANAPLVSQIRYGEFVDVFETRDDGFAWVQNRSDRYVGYMPLDYPLGETIAMMSNRVTSLRCFVYAEPNVKTQPIDELTLGSFVSIVGQQGKFLELTSGGFISPRDVAPTEIAQTKDYVFTAGRLLNTPYLWGGRTPKGIDCSGLVQLALELAGIDAPRDCDQQCEAFGKPLACHWRDRAWQRGDIVFFRHPRESAHLGIMTDGEHIIHANQNQSMSVIVEPLKALVGRELEIVAVGVPEE